MTAQSAPPAPNAPFGSVFASTMAVAEWANEEWSAARLDPVEPFAMHPATHVLHYGSACFEGLKAHRGLDGKVRVFRLDAHVRRMQRSANWRTSFRPRPLRCSEELCRSSIRCIFRASSSRPARTRQAPPSSAGHGCPDSSYDFS